MISLLAQTATDVLAAVVGAHTAVIVGLVAYAIRTRERLVRLEEWARIEEKRRSANGVRK